MGLPCSNIRLGRGRYLIPITTRPRRFDQNKINFFSLIFKNKHSYKDLNPCQKKNVLQKAKCPGTQFNQMRSSSIFPFQIGSTFSVAGSKRQQSDGSIDSRPTIGPGDSAAAHGFPVAFGARKFLIIFMSGAASSVSPVFRFLRCFFIDSGKCAPRLAGHWNTCCRIYLRGSPKFINGWWSRKIPVSIRSCWI